MAGTPGLPCQACPLRAREVGIQDGSLLWAASEGGSHGQVRVDEVVFTLDLSESNRGQSGFIICCLKEDPGQPTQPFQLRLLAADAVPNQLLGQHAINKMPSYLCSDDGNEVDVIVSTKSGLGLSATFWHVVLQPLWSLAQQAFGAPPLAPKVLVTQDAQSVRRFARTLQPGQHRTIVLLSGDGAVVDLLNGYEALSSAPSVALVPLGTGNALFHSIHRPVMSTPGPSPLVLGLRTLFLGVPAELPVFRAEFSPGSHIVSYAKKSGRANSVDKDAPVARHDSAVSLLYGAIVASYGFHASIVYESDTPEHRIHGDKRFDMVAKELLREPHPYRANLSVRKPSSTGLDPDPHGTHIYVLVSMVSNLERTFTISPASEPLDGKLHLVHFGPVGGERTMDVMRGAYDGGKHVGMKWGDGQEVRYEQVEGVKVEALDDDERWRKFCVDGTIVEVPKGGSMYVSKAQRGPLRVLVDGRVRVEHGES